MSQSRARKVTAAFTIAIAVADILQPILLPFRPKFYASIAGAILYSSLTVLLFRPRRWPLVVIASLPVLPLSTIAAWALGAFVRVDREMIGVACLQIAAALSAARAMSAQDHGSPSTTL